MIKISFRIFLIIFIPFFVYPQLSAQHNQVSFERLTVEDGLSENLINCLLQDSDGFMWIGTNNGLNKYDGYEFKIYKNILDDSSSLSDNYIHTMYEDQTGQLWIGVRNGLNLVNHSTETFTRYQHDQTNVNHRQSNDIYALFEDTEKRFWVGTRDGLYLFDRIKKQFFYSDSQFNGYSERLIHYTDSIFLKQNPHIAILKAGNKQNLKKEFSILQTTNFLIHCSGEFWQNRLRDYGWIENSQGREIWRMDPEKISYAGGYRNNREQIALIKLPAGKYSLHYRSDKAFSFEDNWEGLKAPRYKNLWGIQLYHVNETEADSISAYLEEQSPMSGGIYQTLVNDISGDSSNNLWLSTNSGMFKVDYGQNVITRFDTIFKPRDNHVQSFDYDDGSNFLYDDLVSLYQDKSENLWIGGHFAQLAQFDPLTGETKLYEHSLTEPIIYMDRVSSIIEDRSGILWYGIIGHGLKSMDRTSGKISSFKYDAQNPWSLSHNDITTLFEDRQGILWIGSYFGISKLDKNRNKFINYQQDPADRNSERDKVVNIFQDSYGIIWLSTFKAGLFSFDRTTNTYINYLWDPDNAHSISSNIVIVIYEDKQGVLWIGTDRGLNKFDRKSQRFTRYNYDPKDIKTLTWHVIADIYEDKDETLWIVTGSGFNKFDRLTGTVIRYYPPFNYGQSTIFKMLGDKNGNLWFGTWGEGLMKYNPADDTYLKYKNIPGDDQSIISDYIITLHMSTTGIIWIGSGTGLNKFDPNENKWAHYSESDGLPSNVIVGILEDKKGNLWLSTLNGISHFDPGSNKFINFDESDGLRDKIFFWRSCFRSNSGEMFFGGGNGIHAFYPENIIDDQTSPIVHISDLFYLDNSGEKYISKKLVPGEVINLNHDQNDLHFKYVGIQYSTSKKIIYKYMLENYNESWIKAGHERQVSYTNLNPGDYTFQVMASNGDDVWVKQESALKIIISPPWWQTSWAYILYLICFISLIVVARRYELTRIHLKNQVKLDEIKLKEREQVDQMKSTFFANISHEFRTPLTLILGPINKILTKEKDESNKHSLHLMQRNAKRLLHLINQLLDFSKLESGKMSLQASAADIVAFVKGITMAFQSLAKQKNITFRFSSDRDNIEIFFDRDKMEKIFSNLLSNAFKITPDYGEISVDIREIQSSLFPFTKDNTERVETPEQSDGIRISVRDSGKGIAREKLEHIFERFFQADETMTREQEGTGIGLALTKELVELHYGKITVDSREGYGAEFSVFLRQGSAHLSSDEIIARDISITGDSPEADDLLNTITEDVLHELLGSQKGREIILVIEDNADMRSYICETLKDNYQLQEAFDGEEGLEKAQKIIPDLIISDIMMPKKDGYQVCAQLKQHELTSHIPVILLTARAEREDKLEGLQLGADDYLVKPFDSQELKIRIKNLLDVRKRLKSVYSQGKEQISTENKSGVILNPVDERFIVKVHEIIQENLQNEQFGVEQFSRQIGMSGTQLRRKMNGLTGQSPNQYIRTIRLREAARLIREENQTVSEAAYQSGFNNLSYFSKCFQEEYGSLPSEF